MFTKRNSQEFTGLNGLGWTGSGAILNPLQFLMVAVLISVPATAAPKADMSRLVVLGDSLSAGFQNGGLMDTQQVNGYASLVANQTGFPLAMPLIAAPGIPNIFTLVSPGPPPVIVPLSGTSTGRDNPFLQPMDLAVPAARMQEILSNRPDFPIDSLTDLVLGLPGLLSGISRSQVEWAENLAPTTVIAWMGNMDVLRIAFYANPVVMTSVSDFETQYNAATGRLAATGATLVLANIPDVTAVPFMVPAEKIAPGYLAYVGPILGIGSGDFILADALPLVSAILNGTAVGPLPESVVLDAGEVTIVRARTDAFNALIAAQAARLGAGLVDVHAIVDQIRSQGYVSGGQRLTTDFLGGIFSLDGIHPTNTGYAILANAFIKELNTRFAAAIPPVNVEQIKIADPLVLQGVGQPAAGLGHVSPETARSLRSVMFR